MHWSKSGGPWFSIGRTNVVRMFWWLGKQLFQLIYHRCRDKAFSVAAALFGLDTEISSMIVTKDRTLKRSVINCIWPLILSDCHNLGTVIIKKTLTEIRSLRILHNYWSLLKGTDFNFLLIRLIARKLWCSRFLCLSRICFQFWARWTGI